MPRLRRADCSSPGIRRRRRGKGFTYHWESTGERVNDPDVLSRITSLVLPPAWEDVWICPHPNGHLQAVGTDAAGRKQYRYHDQWRTRRDSQKFESMLEFAGALPDLRAVVEEQLFARDTLDRDRVLACSVRLLDRGFFRIGTEIGRSGDLETFGLTTMRKEHVTLNGNGVIAFEYLAKGGKHRVESVVDPAVTDIISALKRRRAGGDELLAYRDGRAWVDITARDVNAWIKEATGGDFSAKDFRTWSATLLAAIALSVSGPAAASKTARKRAEARAAKEVAHYLGNTPTVARNSYIDPRVFDRYRSGWLIGVHDMMGNVDLDLPTIPPEIEMAVLDLLLDPVESDAVEKVTSLAS